MIQDTSTSHMHPSWRIITKAACLSIFLTFAVIMLAGIRETPNSLPKSERRQIINGPAVTFMGSDTLNKGYNFLRGAGADPKYARAVGQFTLDMAKTLEYGGTVYYQPDQVDLTMNAGCQSNSDTRTVETTNSASSVTSQAKSKSESFSAQMEVGGGFGSLSGKGGGGMAMSFGKSSASRDARSYASQGFMSSSQSWVRSTLFNAFVDWKGDHRLPNGSRLSFAYEPQFLADADAINAASLPNAEKLVMEFFERWGTHVIGEATYGSQCSSTMYMASSAQSIAASRMAREAGTRRLEWNAYAEASYGMGSASASASGSQSSKFSQKTTTSGTYAGGTSYEIGNVKCEGYIKDNLCNENFRGAEDNPVMIEYTPIEIWTVKKGDGTDVFTPAGVNNVNATLAKIGQRMEVCHHDRCNNGGWCVMATAFWDSVREGNYHPVAFATKLDAFDQSCICDNGAAGNSGCKFGKSQIDKIQKLFTHLTGNVMFEFMSMTGPAYGITYKFYNGTGYRKGVAPIDFQSASMCARPNIALGWNHMSGKNPANGYYVNASIEQDSITSTGFGLQLVSAGGIRDHAVQLSYFATCDPRIAIGSRSRIDILNPISEMLDCPVEKRNVYLGLRRMNTMFNWISISFDQPTARISALESGTGHQGWQAMTYFTVDYVAWCQDNIPRNEMQTGSIFGGFFVAPWSKSLSAGFSPPMNCENPQISFAIVNAASVLPQVAKVHARVHKVSKFGFELHAAAMLGSYHGIYFSWLAFC